MNSLKFNDEIINLEENSNNIYDLNIFTNENYYLSNDSKIIGMYYNNNYENNDKFNDIIKKKILNKIKKEYNKNIDELNITDNEDFIQVSFFYNDCIINISFCKKHKIFTSNIPINMINRNENFHILEYLYSMNVYYNNKYKILENKFKIISIMIIIQFLILFLK